MPRRRFLPWLFLGLLRWRRGQEAADDLGGRLQDEEEHPQQEGANLAGHSQESAHAEEDDGGREGGELC